MKSDTQEFDAVVIGAGPAGSSAATVLAGHGRRVVILERQRFPRYRIGESLLPYCYFPLERLGMIDKLKASRFVKKYSVQFVGLSGRVSQPFYFFEHIDHAASQTWQVVRSDFDQMLLDNACEHGADVMHETSADELLLDGDRVVGVRAKRGDGHKCEVRAPVTIDASGRDAFAVNELDWIERDPQLTKIAMWTYYKGAKRDPGLDQGATTVAYLPDKGWFWYIPLPDDLTSVGVVAQREYLYRGPRDPQAIIDREIQCNPWITEHLAGAVQEGPIRVTGDYSYRSRYCAGDGLVLTGDAFSFVDPVFSSGVFLALRGGEMCADTVHHALDAGDTGAHMFADYGAQLCIGIESMRKLVYAFYDTAFSFGDMLRVYPHLRGDLTDCLIGNLHRDFDPLFKAVAEFAKVPAPLAHGGPLVLAG